MKENYRLLVVFSLVMVIALLLTGCDTKRPPAAAPKTAVSAAGPVMAAAAAAAADEPCPPDACPVPPAPCPACSTLPAVCSGCPDCPPCPEPTAVCPGETGEFDCIAVTGQGKTFWLSSLAEYFLGDKMRWEDLACLNDMDGNKDVRTACFEKLRPEADCVSVGKVLKVPLDPGIHEALAAVPENEEFILRYHEGSVWRLYGPTGVSEIDLPFPVGWGTVNFTLSSDGRLILAPLDGAPFDFVAECR